MSGVLRSLTVGSWPWRVVVLASVRSFATGVPEERMYECIHVEKKDNVGVLTLNRPRQLNALNAKLMEEVNEVLRMFDADPSVRCIVLTGSGTKAFASGADIKEMATRTYSECVRDDFLQSWEDVMQIRKPILAAVNGYALGGGCELAMMCDIIYASETAKFGQPEIKLGTTPGGGGTQRLARALGKTKAMDLILSGDMMSAHDAERHGLVARIFSSETLLEETMKQASKIAAYSTPIVMKCKEAVNRSLETSLTEGLLFERRLFHGTFALNDQKEGMAAFLEKRPPKFTDT